MTDDIDALEAVVEALSRACALAELAEAVGIDGDPLLMGLFPDLSDPYGRFGYNGSRCGWYPAKPKRRKR